MYEHETTVDDYTDQVAIQEATEVLMRAGLVESDAEDFAWDVARVIAPRAMAAILHRVSGRGGETVSTVHLGSLANSWANYEHER